MRRLFAAPQRYTRVVEDLYRQAGEDRVNRRRLARLTRRGSALMS
jgi:hypothetical protein